MKRKTKSPSEPSLRDKLSANFMKAFQSDFEAHGVAAIEALRAESPSKYAEIASRLIAQTEPPAGIFDQAKSMEDIGRGLLVQVGLTDPSDAQIEKAIQANDELVARLEAIAVHDDELANLEMAAALEASGIRQ